MNHEKQLIESFVNTNKPFYDILSDVASSDSEIIQLIIQIEESWKRRDEDAKKILKKIDYNKLHLNNTPDIMILFSLSWAKLLSSISRDAEACRILKQAESQISKNIEPVIRSCFYNFFAMIQHRLAKVSSFMIYYQKALDGITLSSPREISTWVNANIGFAMIKEFDKVKDKFKKVIKKSKITIPENLINAVYLTDSIARCLKDKTEYYMYKITPWPQQENMIMTVLINGFHFLDKTDQMPHHFKTVYEKYYDMQFESAIQKNDLPKAEKLIQIIEKANNEGATFRAKLEFALTTKNTNNAEYYLNLICDEQGLSYFENYFFLRLMCLKGDYKKANSYYQQLLSDCSKYNTLNALDFQLEASSEFTIAEFRKTLSPPIPNLKSQNNKTTYHFKKSTLSGVDKLIGNSKSLKLLKETIIQYCNSRGPMLITGETGTGKEIIANAIHEESDVKKEPFIPINCGALTDGLLQSELFGHVKGAFTGAVQKNEGLFKQAGKGTIFLDEIGEISPKLQVSLLRVLESNEVRAIGSSKPIQIHCKIVAATNASLKKLVAKKLFREDLYFRLKKFEINSTPLRKRKEDIIALTNHFLSFVPGKAPTMSLSNKATQALQDYQWPGNVRELKNEMEKIKFLFSEKEILEVKDFTFLKSDHQITTEALQSDQDSEKSNDKPMIFKKELADNIINSNKTAFRRIERIKVLFATYPKLTRVEIVQILSLNPRTTSNDLKVLLNENFIVKVMPNAARRSHYFMINDK